MTNFYIFEETSSTFNTSNEIDIVSILNSTFMVIICHCKTSRAQDKGNKIILFQKIINNCHIRVVQERIGTDMLVKFTLLISI